MSEPFMTKRRDRSLRIAFATYRGLPDLSTDDRLALDYLNQNGIATESPVWDAPNVVWEDFDCVIVRSCWDYHLRYEAFAKWISLMEKMGVAIWNPPSVIRWNMDKTYLSELERKGISVAPTVWLRKGSTIDLKKTFKNNGWLKAVIKPTISATAFQTWVTGAARIATDGPAIQEMLGRSGVMLQQFIEEVPVLGEWSFVFFNKVYSHAVLKRAKEGDFRVQTQFGGYLDEDARPSHSLIEQARRVVESVEEPLLFARVDGVEVAGRFILMELEPLK